jgi:hypothetical protein
MWVAFAAPYVPLFLFVCSMIGAFSHIRMMQFRHR